MVGRYFCPPPPPLYKELNPSSITVVAVPATGQYGAPPAGMPSYMPGGMPPYGQGPPMVPPFQGGTHMGMRPPAMSPAGRY